jgi:TonB family protein
MSPEQAWGKDIDHRSDIFSLGLVLYEMLVSEKVFEGNSELSVLEQVRDPIIQAPSMKNPDVDPEIDRIVFSALNPDREQRCQSAQDLQRDLERVMRSRGWSPDRKMLSDFLRHLGHGTAAVPSRPAVAATSQQADVSAAAPPADLPPGRPAPPAPQSPEPADDSSADALVANQDLDMVLTDAATPPPLVGGYDLDGSDAGVGHSAVAGGRKKMIWIAAVALVILGAAGAGWWFLMGPGAAAAGERRSSPIAVVPPLETPTPEPTIGLMSEDELLERAREVAAAEIVRQEEELRQRLQEEFPTPTPIPPTWTPTETHTPVPTATSTWTPLPPTATRVPPTRTPIPPTATPSVREGDLVNPGPEVTPPKIISRDPPVYPSRAQSMGLEGVVEVQALIGIDGSVEEIRIVSVTRKGVGFEDATRNAVMKWRYQPATKMGVRVRTWLTIRMPFRLR